MTEQHWFQQHLTLSRRFFLQLAAGSATSTCLPRRVIAEDLPPECARACRSFVQQMDYLTPQADFGNVSRGDPRPYDLSSERKRQVGLVPETWRLEVVADPEHPAEIEHPMSISDGTALDWSGLMKLAEQHTVSFPKIMTCNNIGAPLGMGFWEGVPLREIIWRTKPKQDLRRVFYHGYHNDDPKQMFRSSLPVGRVLEDPFNLPPVIVCFKLNGQLLNGERGGPVRMVVPEAYGFKSVKWLNRIVLSNLFHANDTYADGNNDVDSWMKTFARKLLMPEQIRANEPIPVTGYAQVGISGLSRVQTCILPAETEWPEDDPYFTRATWTPAHIMDPPERWGGDLPDGQLPKNMHAFDPETQRPQNWPMRFTKAHWATLLPGLSAGKYTLRCRSIDAKGVAQPMPRPFHKSGRNRIETVSLVVG